MNKAALPFTRTMTIACLALSLTASISFAASLQSEHESTATPVKNTSFEVAAELYRQNNYREAFQAFHALAIKGEAQAQTVTALMLKFGEGTEQDLAKAFDWYWKAAQQQYPAAQYHVGAMLADGMGIAKDEQQAIHWLTRAAENDFDRAIEKLAELNASANILSDGSQSTLGWSQNWDLKLPTELVLEEIEQHAVIPNQRYVVQVGAMSTRASAHRLWDVLVKQHQNLFRNRVPIIETTTNSERRIYRIQTGPFPDFRSADEFCGRLMVSTVQAGCLPIKRP